MTPYEKQQKEWKKRRDKARRLQAQGFTHKEIGQRLTPKVTSQAVSKLLSKKD